MKHFIVEITYTVPLEQMTELTPLHRAFLREGYDRGWLLMSGPQVPRVGGIIVARAPSLEALQDLFANDPYVTHQVASYRYVEFDPLFRQSFLEDWVTKQP
ncbi:MAG: YciI family protein [Anaerolineae bacterium]|nr:YciI family protein [Thermoflexales bacterium]MDW8408321.1 YciI family protein [Anaerolineae bacterium]